MSTYVILRHGHCARRTHAGFYFSVPCSRHALAPKLLALLGLLLLFTVSPPGGRLGTIVPSGA